MGTDTTDKSRRVSNEETSESVLPQSENSSHKSVYVSPSEFRMRVLRKLVSIDGSHDNKGVKKYQRQDSDRTLKASIVFPNGDVGTIISYSKKENGTDSETETVELPNLKGVDSSNPTPRYKERPLRLPPIILPRIYNMKPLPIIPRDFSVPTDPPTPVTDEQWEDLQECRYLRQYSPRKYRSTSIYG